MEFWSRIKNAFRIGEHPREAAERPPVLSSWERRGNKRAYQEAFARLSEVLSAVDLIRIQTEENPREYEPEVGAILTRLPKCGSSDDVCIAVNEVFHDFFGCHRDRPETYQRVAEMIWNEVVPLLQAPPSSPTPESP